MTDWQRLEQVIKWTGLSTNAFASAIGLKRSENLYQIKRGNNRISKNLAELIAAKYPVISPAWLLTDQGEMLTSAPSEATGRSTAVGIPYYNKDVLRVVSSAETLPPTAHLQLPGFEECSLAALAPAQHLDDSLPTGAILLLQEVGTETLLLPDEIYVVVTADYALLRYLKPDPTTPGGLLLVTRNTAEAPLPVRRDQLQKLLLVKGWIVRKVL